MSQLNSQSLTVAILEQQDELISTITQQRGVLPRVDVERLMQQYQCTFLQLLEALLPIAATFAKPPISEFYVGAIAVGEQINGFGALYFGANLEFNHQALSLVVHAEQAALNTAWLNGEKTISVLAITDAPCGYCRQFINELNQSSDITILLGGELIAFTEFLPRSFGPTDLGNHESFLNSRVARLCVVDTEFKVPQLVSHAEQSYVPYTKNYASCMIVCQDGSKYYGRYAENAAYSPSLSPLQSAISQLILSGQSFDSETIKAVYLAQMKGAENQTGVAKAVLDSFDFNVPLYFVALETGQKNDVNQVA
ncbi:cytidine deaminase [Pseudoalteromonas tunicata]|uniref:cytidine deaminase n=1 Tax=Pseudoalteromonas tunicata TaxID=314281 RepID=UPI00273F6AC0|nr:cytidine deaminase [Pseudoalteromonas tunicata]MDP4984873.1 cytidine deaminase [Pseudoalteromonas tunicata]MDP5213856.1 cytidine deaminase [Pseudoalteromonas tunicata]